VTGLSPAQLEQRRLAPLKHGATAGALALSERAGKLADYFRDLAPVLSDSDAPTIALLAYTWARIEAANEYLNEHGVLDEHGVPRPVTKQLSTWENSAARLLDRLAMTPTSRGALGLDLERIRVLAKPRDLSGLTARELAELRALVAKAEERAAEEAGQ
jgi:terminase small subunit-like protein